MNKSLLVFALLGLFAVAFVEARNDARMHFAGFMKKFEKNYGSHAEAEKRFAIFQSNLAKIARQNLEGHATFAVNKFADLTAAEFKAQMHPTTFTAEQLRNEMTYGMQGEEFALGAIPAAFDWRSNSVPVVTPVKDQGQCGSCWSFSTTGATEGAWALAGNKLTSLSEQNIVDCSNNCDADGVCNSGCNGGLPSIAYQYIINNGGVDTESSYPYTAMDGTCHFSASNIGAKISNWTALPTDENQIAAYLVNNGPVSVALNANSLQTYSSGVLNPLSCPVSEIDHAVLLVGYGTSKNIFGQTEDYWIVKNSWGASWGEQGYFRIKKGVGKCGINLYATQPIV